MRDVSTDTPFGPATKASPGDTIEYHLIYSRPTDADSDDVVFDDVIAPGQTFSSCSDGCLVTGATVSWEFPVIQAGATQSVTFQVTLNSTFPSATTQILNQATTSNLGGESTLFSNQTVVTVIEPVSPQSSIAKAVKNISQSGALSTSIRANPGDTIEYDLTYTNLGNGAATDVVVTDTLAAGQMLVDCDGCVNSSGVLTWNLDSIAPTGSSTVTITVQLDGEFPNGTDYVYNVAGAVSDGESPVQSNQTAILIDAQAALRVVKSSGGVLFRRLAGGTPSPTITYTFLYENSGNNDATETVLSDNLPSNTTFSSCTGGCTLTGNTVNWDLGTVSAHSDGMVTLTLNVDTAVSCEVCNIASIASRDEENGEAIPSNLVCDEVAPLPDPAGAHASGSAFGAEVGLLDLFLAPVSSTESGVGADHHSNTLGSGSSPGVLSLGLLDTESTSVVSADSNTATDTSVASTANINLLGGVIQAPAIRGVAYGHRLGRERSRPSTNGSTLRGPGHRRRRRRQRAGQHAGQPAPRSRLCRALRDHPRGHLAGQPEPRLVLGPA